MQKRNVFRSQGFFFFVCVCFVLGSRDGSMGLWEVSEEVLSLAEKQQVEEGVPSYAHISHRALKDIPKEYTHPYNCKVRALAFNNSHKVSLRRHRSRYLIYKLCKQCF